MANDLDLSDLAEVRRRVVDPVLGALLRPGELESAELVAADDWPDVDEETWAFKRWPNNPDAVRPGDAPNSLYLDLRATGDERHTACLGELGFHRHDAQALADDLASRLSDWVCETRFAWGDPRVASDLEIPAGAAGELWLGDGHLSHLDVSGALAADLGAWQDRYHAWLDEAAAEEHRRYSAFVARSSPGFSVTYVDSAKAAAEAAAVREARSQAHLGRWRQFVAEMEPARDALLDRLRAELGDRYAVPVPARIL
jgi:hypothetical protein